MKGHFETEQSSPPYMLPHPQVFCHSYGNLPTVPTSQMQLELALEKALAQRKVSFQESVSVSGACGEMGGNGRDWYCEGQKEA